MSLRDRIEAKQRRRAVVPVEVSPATEDQTVRATALRVKLAQAVASSDSDEATRLTAELTAVESENVVDVGFTALDPDVFEKVVSTFPAEDGSGMDREAALPVLAALCADDEDLQDDEWWAEQVTSGTWSYGERMDLWSALLAINSRAPGAYVPKG